MAAAGGPDVGEHFEGGGLARPGGGEDQLDPAAVRGHGPHHLLSARHPATVPVASASARPRSTASGLQGLPVGQSSRVHELAAQRRGSGWRCTGSLPATVNTDAPSVRRSSVRQLGRVVDRGEPDGPGDRLLHHGLRPRPGCRRGGWRRRGAAVGFRPTDASTARSPDAPPVPRAPGPRSRARHTGGHRRHRRRPAGSAPDRSIASIRSGPPSVSTASVRQTVRCSARVRGSCLRVAGLQRGLLRQLQHLHPARRPAMITGEVGGELGPADVDDLPPCRPALVQPRIHADDLPDRPLRPVPAGPFGEPHPKDWW